MEQVCEIQRSIDHIPVVPAAEVVDAAGQLHGGEKVCDDLPHIAHAPVVAAGKAQHFAGLRGLQKVQRQIAPDGQPPAREIVHPRQTERHGVRAAGHHPRLGLELVPTVDIGGGEG